MDEQKNAEREGRKIALNELIKGLTDLEDCIREKRQTYEASLRRISYEEAEEQSADARCAQVGEL